MDKKKNTYNRRDFIKLLGYTAGSTALMASCEQPVRKAIPYLIQPEEIIPGKANYYASTFYENGEYNSILVKVRDGRPIKIEGNDLSPISRGATSARVQASVIELYDPDRLQFPTMDGERMSWEEFDGQVIERLKKIQTSEKKLVVIAPTVISPSTKKVFEIFKTKYPNSEIIVYDSHSVSALLEANEMCFGQAMIPTYRFDKADLMVSFGADFLGSWISPVEFTKQWSERKQKDKSARLISFEAGMSITGSNANKRFPIKPSDEFRILKYIYETLQINDSGNSEYQWLVDELKDAKKHSMLISGSDRLENQILVNSINNLLGNYGMTIFPQYPVHTKQALDRDFKGFKNDLFTGKIGGMIYYQTNPVYDKNLGDLINTLSDKPDVNLFIGTHPNETSALANFICPSNHFLESWDDANPKKGSYSLSQPVIRNIFETRQPQDSLLHWCETEMPYKEIIRDYWKESLFSDENDEYAFDQFWLKILQKGVFEKHEEIELPEFNSEAIRQFLDTIKADSNEDIEFIISESTKGITGSGANNPWLHELPGQVSKICWDNFASIPKSLATDYNLENGDVISINDSIEIPVLIQPGQANKTISLISGYGRTNSGRIAEGVGVNVLPLLTESEKSESVTIRKTGKTIEFARTQATERLFGRELMGNSENKSPSLKQNKSFYKQYEYPIHHWGMVVDLNACTSCGACVVACQAENNVPIVGKEEVKRGHDMHWMRIDRYYSGETENPEVMAQPVLCQHCDQAPCENVCPVSATTHSSEGLNQMIYNRCIGTRYCANNCPYEVRKFNWFDYNGADFIKGNEHDKHGLASDLPRMLLNPDVTIRSKGVIEKCSFCIQRIEYVKNEARNRKEKRQIFDGEIKPACAQVCPANAIVFGDLNDKNSCVSQLKTLPENFDLLGGLGTKPSVSYLERKNVRNPEKNE
jgi:molybdopterin-containing oxidoreductase family iron-sulfur binding subunit